MSSIALHATPSLPDRLALIIAGLCHAVAARGAKDRGSVPLVVLAWARLCRLSARFAALAAVRADRLPAAPVVRRRADPVAASLFRLPALSQPHRLPGGFGWLLRLVPEAAAYGGHVQHLLADPEMAALLRQAPQAARILRPLCRMLAIRPGPALRAPRPSPGVAAMPDKATPDGAIPDGQLPDWARASPRSHRLPGAGRTPPDADPPLVPQPDPPLLV